MCPRDHMIVERKGLVCDIGWWDYATSWEMLVWRSHVWCHVARKNDRGPSYCNTQDLPQISSSSNRHPSLGPPLSSFPCFTFISISLLPSHHMSPYLTSLLSLIPCNTIDFLFTLTHCHFVIVLLSYSSNSTITHSPWLIASFPLYINP